MIREARLEDAGSIAAIIVNAWQAAYTGIIDPAYPQTMQQETFTKIMQKNISEHLEKIYVYEKEHHSIGFVSGKLLHDIYDAEIVGLYVLPAHQGTGIGSALFGQMQTYFRTHSCRSMIIWTLQDARNNAFYQKQGGIAREIKELHIGGTVYPGVGFYFAL